MTVLDMSKIKPLDVERREQAKHRAVSTIVKSYGERPQRENFEQDHFESLPPEVKKLVTRIFIAIVVSLFPLSAIRLFVMGSAAFERHPVWVQVVAGVATVCAAEISILGFSLATSTFATTKWSKRMMFFGIGAAGIFALIANLEYSRPWARREAFLWLESTVPVVLFVIGAMALERRFLYAVQERHRVNREFERALADWKALTSDPTSHPHWIQFYANALRDEIYRQSRGAGRDMLNDLPTQDWIDLVQREIDADNWFLNSAAQPDESIRIFQPHNGVVGNESVLALELEASDPNEVFAFADNGHHHPKGNEDVSNV
jgi:hypothetical protein